MNGKKLAYRIGIAAVCTVLNILLGLFADVFRLPVLLDTAGVMLAIHYTGAVGGAASALLTGAALALMGRAHPVYMVVMVALSMLMFIFIKNDCLKNISKAVPSCFWIGVISTGVFTFYDILFSGMTTNNLWGDALIDMLDWNECPHIIAVIAGEALIQLIDKQLCMLAAFLLIRLDSVIKSKKTEALKPLSVIAAAAVAASLLSPINAEAAEELKTDKQYLKDNFATEIYNNSNGMLASEANTIGETEDGCIWIGSYAGLTRYDGSRFEFIREGGLVSVMCMITDSRGRLWMGTNDAGVAVYDNGSFTFLDDENGLPANSVRSLADDGNGNIYVGTTDRMCLITEDMEVIQLPYSVKFAKSIVVCGGIPVVMDNDGKIYALYGDREEVMRGALFDTLFMYSLAEADGELIVGTDTGELFVVGVGADGFTLKKEIENPALTIQAVMRDSKGRIWLGTESGISFIDDLDKYHVIHSSGFENSFDSFHEDYQGNIWVASSRYGVMKITESRFVDLFDAAGINDAIINAVVHYNNDFYCGTDNGLLSLDGTTLKNKRNGITKQADNCRVRCVYKDSKNKLWICTYSDNGLICYDDRDGLSYYNSETAPGVTSNRFRCITELSDGTMAAGTINGVNFIKDGKLTGTITSAEGLENTQVLTISEDSKGRAMIGTDGAGIYLVSDGRIVGRYSKADGLSSNVILRIIAHDDGCFAVTSNAICHIDNDGNIRRITSFPYFNNYDMILDGDTAYVLCSAGIYKASVSDLCSDSGGRYRLYGASDGLMSGLTANSWNYLYSDGTLYLCSNSGVIAFLKLDDEDDTEMKFGVSSVECDNNELISDGENGCTISPETKHVTLSASVRNYTLSDAKVRFYVEGGDERPREYAWNAIEPIHLTIGDEHEYTVRLQILDNTLSTVYGEKVYTVTRSLRVWENTWFRSYLLIAVIEAVLFSLVSIAIMINNARRGRMLEKMRIELEQKVKEQTEKILEQQEKTQWLYVQTVMALGDAVDAKDHYTSGHSKRVAEYARSIAAKMGKSVKEQEEIYRAGLLHDVGKIRIPVEIINKPGKLTAEEYDMIKIHPITGYHILRRISGTGTISLGAKYHHERYDGRGYPNGISGENIPEVARILGVADAYDAMASNRSYRDALPQEVVRSEIENGKGKQFDPYIADIMLKMIDEDKNYDMKQSQPAHHCILVIDDDEINITVITKILDNYRNYSVVSAENGSDGLRLFKQIDVDLILLDLLMDDIDGFEVLEEIRQTSSVPVVLMTGERDTETMKKASRLGCDDYITKPFQALQIKEVIRAILGDD